jgi:hypothetical protein
MLQNPTNLRQSEVKSSDILNPQSKYNQQYEKNIDKVLGLIPNLKDQLDELLREIGNFYETEIQIKILENKAELIMLDLDLSEEDLNNTLKKYKEVFPKFRIEFIEKILTIKRLNQQIKNDIEDVIIQVTVGDEVMSTLEPRH